MEKTPEQESKINLAKGFAAKKFAEAGTGNHYLEVFKILQDDFQVEDQDVLVAALLHDTLEDTDTTHEELEQHFRKAVADMVDEVSHPKNYNHEQRLEYYEKLKHISSGAKLIKLADFASHLKYFIGVYKAGKQNLNPKNVNNDKYVAQIKEFLDSCPDSAAKETVSALANELEGYL